MNIEYTESTKDAFFEQFTWQIQAALLMIMCYSWTYDTVVSIVGRIRTKTFTKEHLEKFADVHKEAYPGKFPAMGGYPDVGNGNYSKTLDYKAWMRFNCAQRIQAHFLEHLTLNLVLGMLGAVAFPIPALIINGINLTGRCLYTMGYMKKGP